MKEDYLWDKNGNDPEIERLENALAMFRYAKTDAPALPAKIIPFERKQPRNFLRLVFAFGACAAVVAICLGVWLQTSVNKIDVAANSPQAIAPQIIKKTADTIPLKSAGDLLITPSDQVVETVENSKLPIERKIIKVRDTVPPVARQNKSIAKNIETKKPAVKLTKDEKYAYDQLMLALSITSSKFKLVKDKVDGTEEKNAVLENAR